MRTTDGYKKRIARIQYLTRQLQTISSELYLLGNAELDPDMVLRVVESVFGYDAKIQSRKSEIVDAKVAVTFLLKEYSILSDLEISKAVGGSEHSTVYHRYGTAKDRMDTESSFKDKIQKCKEKILLLM